VNLIFDWFTNHLFAARCRRNIWSVACTRIYQRAWTNGRDCAMHWWHHQVVH
jgi:hypothetical protein